MKTANPSWTLTPTKWKEASRSPRKPIVLGFFVAMIAMTSAITINAQAVPMPKALETTNMVQMPAHAPTTRAATTSMKETISLILNIVRQTNRKTIS